MPIASVVSSRPKKKKKRKAFLQNKNYITNKQLRMGTDLYQLGNHKISFKNRQFSEIANEIKITLDRTIFPNADFLKLAALRWANSEPKNESDIQKIKTKTDWTFREEDDYYNFRKDKYIEFEGPFDLELTFNENKITFWNPPYRYSDWFEMNENHRDEWRKYMCHIIKLFGGDRVVYLADNTHPLNDFIYCEGTFEEMEESLFKKFGKPKQTFKEVAENLVNSYYIDDFKTIDWSKSEPLDDYLSELL
jgi:hypothetical protein